MHMSTFKYPKSLMKLYEYIFQNLNEVYWNSELWQWEKQKWLQWYGISQVRKSKAVLYLALLLNFHRWKRNSHIYSLWGPRTTSTPGRVERIFGWHQDLSTDTTAVNNDCCCRSFMYESWINFLVFYTFNPHALLEKPNGLCWAIETWKECPVWEGIRNRGMFYQLFPRPRHCLPAPDKLNSDDTHVQLDDTVWHIPWHAAKQTHSAADYPFWWGPSPYHNSEALFLRPRASLRRCQNIFEASLSSNTSLCNWLHPHLLTQWHASKSLYRRTW